MNLFQEILEDKAHLIERAEALEDQVGTSEAITWYNVRRLTTFMIWDVYAAAALKHHQTATVNNSAPLLNNNAVICGLIEERLALKLEESFFECDEVPWKNIRPDGYSNNPYIDSSLTEDYRNTTIHRIMSNKLGCILTDIFTALEPIIERSLGYYWSVGAVRVYAAKPGVIGGYHSDAFPLSIKKIMIYPSGSGLEQGSTEIVLANGEHRIIEGGKGVWCLFENTLCLHRALGPQIPTPRPTIEVSILPAFRNDPVVRNHGILVGYPWLPPDIPMETKQRIFEQMVKLCAVLPWNIVF